MTTPRGGMTDVLRKVIAGAIAARGLGNLGRPFGAGSGFVVLGHLLRSDAAIMVAAPLFGVAMLVYAWGLWRAQPWAWPVAIAYALWATLNVVLFPLYETLPPTLPSWTYVLFAVPGIAGPWLAVWLLRRA